MTNPPISQTVYSQGGGTTSTGPLITVIVDRDPLPTDNRYPITQRWVNPSNANSEWFLSGYTTTNGVILADWVLLNQNASTSVDEIIAISPIVSSPNPGVGVVTLSLDTIPPSGGGTGTADIPENGQILIGNGTAYSVNNLTSAGSTVSITNGAGTINLEAGNVVGPASSTVGDVAIFNNASGKLLSNVSPGTAGNVLTSNGVGVVPSFKAVSYSPVFLGNFPVTSGSIVMPISFTSYNYFTIFTSGIFPVSVEDIYALFSVDGGITYISSYVSGLLWVPLAVSMGNISTSSNTGMLLASNINPMGGGNGLSSAFTVSNVLQGILYGSCIYYRPGATNTFGRGEFGAAQGADGAPTNIKITSNSGLAAGSGSASLYGFV